jgi:alpha-glucosidase
MTKCVIGVLLFAALGLQSIFGAGTYQVQSPDGQLAIAVSAGDNISCEISYKGRQILISPAITMILGDGRVLGRPAKVAKEQRREVDTTLTPVSPTKQATVRDNFREMTLTFEGDYDLVFRVYDDGAAWRFVTRLGGTIRVKDEQVLFRFPEDFPIVAAISKEAKEKDFFTSCESNFARIKLSDFANDDRAYPPLVVEAHDNVKVALTEADLRDYAGLWLTRSADQPAQIAGVFPHFITGVKSLFSKNKKIERADYIAETDGTRTFPWRVVIVAKDDAGLIENDLVYRLGAEPALKDTSWIKPGKVAWDWWNDNNLWDVEFVAGLNTATYRYYIDFAARNAIEYVIFDAGWSDEHDLFKTNPDMDVPGLIRYANEKGVGVILWCSWYPLDRQLEKALTQFEQWGAKGVKVDYMARDDQTMVRFYRRVTEATAKHRLLLDFHGAYKGTGEEREYPNLITREGVLGLEYNKWSNECTPEHDVTLPFIRMLAGPMDYTPGAMNNAQKKDFRDINERPMSQGTRCHQLAMYVIFESPLQMLSDSPTAYEHNPCCLDFIAKVPTTWDETKVLSAKLGDYVLLARHKGGEWFVGAMTDWDKREMTVDFSFLSPGDYKAAICQDGINAHRMAIDHKHATMTVNAATKLTINLAPGGGWAARITPEK